MEEDAQRESTRVAIALKIQYKNAPGGINL
jgi:hypothetical protein